MLIDILVSAKPLHIVLAKWLKKKQEVDPNVKKVGADLDALKRVDTSGFLLQRTRRISWALEALKTRLSKPVATKESLDWRLFGPVGVMAVAKAIDREAKSEIERNFLLTELCLELGRIEPQSSEYSLDARVVREGIRTASRAVLQKISLTGLEDFPKLRKYLDRALKEAA